MAADTYVALLRGVNVGGNNKVAMAALRSALTDAGMRDVSTYIQSGNIVFGSSLGSEAAVATGVRQCLRAGFGLDVAVIVRTGDDFSALADRGPKCADLDPAKALIVFYPGPVDRGALEQIRPADFLPDTWHAEGRELHLCLSDGIGNSKLVHEIGRKLPGGTGRNWNTVTKLAALVAAAN